MKQKIILIANLVTRWAGSVGAIVASLFSLLIFLVCGFIFGFNNRYQMIANTFMSSVSYIMLFLIQHTQNHDSRALQVKVDELLYAMRKADNRLINIEELDEEQLSALKKRYELIRQEAESVCNSSTLL